MSNNNKWLSQERLDLILAILIALVTVTTALFVWRINVIGSSSEDIVHSALIDAVKKQTSANEDWRKVYEEASYARDFSIYQAGIIAMEKSQNQVLESQASNLRQYLLPNLQLLSSPLGTEPKYLNADGSYDLQKRFSALEAETPDLNNLDPQASFDQARLFYSQQRWQSIGLILLAISLFWLSLAEFSSKWMKTISTIFGLGLFVLGITWEFVIEVYFLAVRGGIL